MIAFLKKALSGFYKKIKKKDEVIKFFYATRLAPYRKKLFKASFGYSII